MQTRNSELLESFTEYCKAHPEERFWQALRNWCGWPFVFVCSTITGMYKAKVEADCEDTFYWETNKGPWEN